MTKLRLCGAISTSLIPFKREPHHYERMNDHLLFFTVAIIDLVFYGLSNPAIAIIPKILGCMFFSAIPCFLIWKDFDAMRERRLFIESFFSEDYWK